MKILAVLLTVVLIFAGSRTMVQAAEQTSDDITGLLEEYQESGNLTELLEEYQESGDLSGLIEQYQGTEDVTGLLEQYQESGDLSGLIEQYQDALKQVLGEMDESTVDEAFTFIKEKAAEGSLESAAGLEEAIAEGKEKFGVEIGEAEVEEVLGLVNQLEEIGFDSEKIIDKAETMYDEYGADFVDHTGEIVVDAVKDSFWTIIKKAVGEFFRKLGESVEKFFTDLF